MKRPWSFTKLVIKYDELEKKHKQVKTRFSINEKQYSFYRTYLKKDLQQDKRIFGYTNQDTIQYFRTNCPLRQYLKTANPAKRHIQQPTKSSSLTFHSNKRKQKLQSSIQRKNQPIKSFAKFINLQNSTAFTSPIITQPNLQSKSQCIISDSQYNQITVNPNSYNRMPTSKTCKYFFNKSCHQKNQKFQKIKMYSKIYKQNFYKNIQHFNKIKNKQQLPSKNKEIIYLKQHDHIDRKNIKKCHVKKLKNRKGRESVVKLSMKEDFRILRKYAYTIKLENKSFEHNMKLQIMNTKNHHQLFGFFLKGYIGKLTILILGTETLRSICIQDVHVSTQNQFMFYQQKQGRCFDIRQLLQKLQQGKKQLLHVMILAENKIQGIDQILYEEFYKGQELTHKQISKLEIGITKYFISRICCCDYSINSSDDLQAHLMAIIPTENQPTCCRIPSQLIEMLHSIPEKDIFIKNCLKIQQFSLRKLLECGINRLKGIIGQQNSLSLKENISNHLSSYRYFYICSFFLRINILFIISLLNNYEYFQQNGNLLLLVLNFILICKYVIVSFLIKQQKFLNINHIIIKIVLEEVKLIYSVHFQEKNYDHSQSTFFHYMMIRFGMGEHYIPDFRQLNLKIIHKMVQGLDLMQHNVIPKQIIHQNIRSSKVISVSDQNIPALLLNYLSYSIPLLARQSLLKALISQQTILMKHVYFIKCQTFYFLTKLVVMDSAVTLKMDFPLQFNMKFYLHLQNKNLSIVLYHLNQSLCYQV